jgi:hypothetical protein
MNFIFALIISLNLFSIDCDRAKQSEPCYGECDNFRDLNKNKICDVWESYHKDFNKNENNSDKKEIKNLKSERIKAGEVKTGVISINKNKEIKSEVQKIDIPQEKNSSENKLLKFGILYIIIVNLLLILVTEIYFKNSQILRKLWNWILFFSFYTSALFGIFRYFGVSVFSPEVLFKLHIQSGIVSTITGTYHIIKRFKCLL